MRKLTRRHPALSPSSAQATTRGLANWAPMYVQAGSFAHLSSGKRPLIDTIVTVPLVANRKYLTK